MRTTKSVPITLNAGRRTIVVKASAAEVYERWSHFEDLPKFMKPLQNVQRIDDTHFSVSWLRDGKEQQSVLHVVLRIPGRRIAWRTISDNFWLGVVSFEPRSSRATEVTLKMRSIVDSSTLSQRLGEYLGSFKQLVESRKPA